MSSVSSSEERIRFRVYYDFASTLCYVAHLVLSDVDSEVEALGVELEWRPIDLTMAAPWDRGDSFTEEVRGAVHQTALGLGIDVEMPDPWLDSRPASQVALAIRSPAAERRWRDAVFEEFFVARRRALTPPLAALARELTGADPPLPGGDDYPEVEACTRDAFVLGITGVPTILLDNWAFGGVHDGPTMVSALSQLADRYRELGASIVN